MIPVRDFVAFDLETTGLDRDADAIIEIGAVRVRNGAPEARMACLAQTARPLTPLVESLTGITAAMLAEAQPLKNGLEEFLAFAGNLPLVAHNADFDAAFLSQALAAAGLGNLPGPVFDSLLLARIAWPRLESHRLESLVGSLGLPPQAAHRALPDAEQAALVWLRAQERIAGFAPATRAAFAHVLASGPDPWRALFAGGADAVACDVAALLAPLRRAAEPPRNPPATPAGLAKPSAPAESLFSGGAVAKAFASLGRPYRERGRQARMAMLAERALQEGRILAVDADPGTGRALACLAAGLRHARSRRRPVVFAAGSRSALERLAEREIPVLTALYPDARAEVLKPPSAYPSPRKLAGILEHPDTRITSSERLALLPLLAWLEEPGDGDIAAANGFNHERHRVLWSRIASDTYAAEPDGPAHAARERARRAQLILIAHDLLLDDLALDFALLPAYENAILDEAHRLPEAGRLRLGREVGFFRLKHILQLIAQSKSDARGLLAELERGAGIAAPAPAERPQGEAGRDEAAGAEGGREEAAGAGSEGGTEAAEADTPGAAGEGASEGASEGAAAGAAEATAAAGPSDGLDDVRALRRLAFEPERQLQKFFNKIARYTQKRRKDGESRLRYADKLVVEFNAGPEPVLAALLGLEDVLRRLEALRADLAPDLRRAADLLRDFRSDLEHLAHPADAGECFWIEDFPNPHRALIRSAPLSFGPALADKFLAQMEAAVLVSPAISVGDDFTFFLRQAGLEPRPERLKTALVRGRGADRPLDPVLIARFAPVLSNANALQSMAAALARGLRAQPRPALVLFTHIGMLKQARALLSEALAPDRRMVLAQHVDGGREGLLHLFRHRPDACLLATEAFVESLDPQDAPAVAAVTKLPFPVPGEPLVAPHLERIQEKGGNPLHEYLLPAAILRLKLELNRLPPPPEGGTAIWILDPRLATEKYARHFQRGLGREAIVAATEEELRALTAAVLAPAAVSATAHAPAGGLAGAPEAAEATPSEDGPAIA